MKKCIVFILLVCLLCFRLCPSMSDQEKLRRKKNGPQKPKKGLRREKLVTLLIYLRVETRSFLFYDDSQQLICAEAKRSYDVRNLGLRGSSLVADVISPQSPLPSPSFPIPPVSTTATWALETFKTSLKRWDMINTLFLTTVAVELTFVALLQHSDRKHTSVASRAILSNFFEEQYTQNHPQYLSGLSRALFQTTFLEIAVYLTFQVLV